MNGITKSSRHQKIIGEFGEHLVCNWLSRSGFEVARVDHTGIDVLARRSEMDRRIGISVKARTRDRIEREKAPVNLFTLVDREKLTYACKVFDCDPWLAIYVEATQFADLYLVSLDHYESAYGVVGRVLYSWKMDTRRQEIYASDPEVKHVRITFTATNWWPAHD